jgi:hypothetical protein
VLQSVERGVEGALGNIERVARDLADAEEHAVTVQRLEGNGFLEHLVQGGGELVCVLAQGGLLF